MISGLPDSHGMLVWMLQLGCSRRFSVERVVSGPGLATVYAYLAKKYPEKVNKKVHAEFQSAKSLQGKVVGEYAKTDELCNKAMEIFVEYVPCRCRLACVLRCN